MSSFYPNTLDQRRLYNSDAKTLLQNWVEEVSKKCSFDRFNYLHNFRKIIYFYLKQ